MAAYWPNFAKAGDPNGSGLPAWPDFTPRGSPVLQLGNPIAVTGVADLDTLKVFDGVYDQARGSHFDRTPATAKVSMRAPAVDGPSGRNARSGRTRP